MSDQKVEVRGGGGVCGLLGVAFVVLKLMGYITWSWWWVTAPFWMPWVVILGLAALMLLGVAVGQAVINYQKRK